MKRKNKLILLLTVIIVLIVITFLILFYVFTGFTDTIKRNHTDIDTIIINSDDGIDNHNNNGNDGNSLNNTNVTIIDKIKDFFSSGDNTEDPSDIPEDIPKEEEYDPRLNVTIEPIVDTSDLKGFISADSEKVWDATNTLNIFKNPYYNKNNIIAPGSFNAYHFQIINKNKNDVTYYLTFNEINDDNVNLLYRIIKNDEFVNKKWSKIEDIYLEEFTISSDEVDDYVLEWKWFDADNDSDLGYRSDEILYQLDLRLVGYSDKPLDGSEEVEEEPEDLPEVEDDG